MAELADAHGSGPCGLTPRGGSSPLDRTNLTTNELLSFLSRRFRSFLHTRNLQSIAHHLSRRNFRAVVEMSIKIGSCGIVAMPLFVGRRIWLKLSENYRGDLGIQITLYQPVEIFCFNRLKYLLVYLIICLSSLTKTLTLSKNRRQRHEILATKKFFWQAYP